MNEGKIVVGVDIGTSKIASVVARVEEDAINVLGISEVKSSGIKKGQIVDIEDAVASINTAIEGAERMAGYSVSRVAASIGGSHIESINSRGVVAVAGQNGEISDNDLTRVIDAAKAVSLSSTKEIIHVLPRNYTVDGQEGIKDPLGMAGVRLEVDTHLVTANAISLRNMEKALNEVGVDLDAAVFSGYASSLSVLSSTEKELGVVLVDIGAGTTDICLYVDGSPSYSSVLPIGARHITNDLAIGLRVSLESAEKIKLFLSKAPGRKSILPQDEDQTRNYQQKASLPKTDEVDITSLNLPEEIKKISKKTLIEGIIRPRLNEIFTMIGMELKKSGFGGQTPAGLVVTGGGARTIGVQESAKRMLAMPVRIGMPIGIKGIIDEIQDTPFATVVGLAMYASTIEKSASLPLGLSIPDLPIGSAFGFVKKIINILKSFIP
ncbi:MAG: cell division protein FtsA [Patescibacteria group bacterium]|nr:cell division protein FtsA [Patescibacteria group bacterium]